MNTFGQYIQTHTNKVLMLITLVLLESRKVPKTLTRTTRLGLIAKYYPAKRDTWQPANTLVFVDMDVRLVLSPKLLEVRIIAEDRVILALDAVNKMRFVPDHSIMVNFDTAVLLRVLQLCAPLMFRVDFTIETATNKAAEIMKTMCMRDVNAKLNLHTLSEAAGTCEEDEEDDAESEDSAAPAKKPKPAEAPPVVWDADFVEAETQRLGTFVWQHLSRRRPSMFERRWWDDRILGAAMADMTAVPCGNSTSSCSMSER